MRFLKSVLHENAGIGYRRKAGCSNITGAASITRGEEAAVSAGVMDAEVPV